MRREEIQEDLSKLAFDFFYWFSRFEFALKENHYLRFHEIGANAEPGWDEFVEKWRAKYRPSKSATYLLGEPPERQVIGRADFDWKAVGLQDCTSDLQRVVRLLKTIRNNLFHGGKHGGAGWDNPRRTHALLVAGTAVLDELVALADLRADYTQYY